MGAGPDGVRGGPTDQQVAQPALEEQGRRRADPDRVADLLDVIEDVAAEQHGVVAAEADQVEDIAAALGVEGGTGLVEQQHRRFSDDGRRELPSAAACRENPPGAGAPHRAVLRARGRLGAVRWRSVAPAVERGRPPPR
jgi:hypothetical protein